MEFYITITIDRRQHSILVRRVHADDRFEIFDLVGKDRTVRIQNNRPLFRGKGVKRRSPDWKVIEGKFDNSDTLDKIADAIMGVLEP